MAAEHTEDYRKLHERDCEPCTMGAPVVAEDEAARLMMSVPAWKRGFHDGVQKLRREFYFREFKDAFAFTRRLAELAEREGHHPTILTEWGQVTVYWWSRKINGLHLNDFIMSAKTDMLHKETAKGLPQK